MDGFVSVWDLGPSYWLPSFFLKMCLEKKNIVWLFSRSTYKWKLYSAIILR